MYTSDTDNVKRWLRRGIVFTAVSIFCAIFGGVYETYSHGVYSFSMIYAFLYPLFFGAFVCLVMALLGRSCRTSASFDFYVFAIASATVGSIVKGILEIYGTSSKLTVVFPILSAVFLIIAAYLEARRAFTIRHRDE